MSNKKRKNQYIEYDYESMFSSNTRMLSEWMIEQMLKDKKRSIYATKEFYLQKNLEIEIYPELTRKELENKQIKKTNKKAQKNLNDKNSRKYVTRLITKNFGDGDYWLTLTYDNNNLPSDITEALKDMSNYVKRINYHLKRKGFSNAKYVYITEYNEDEHSVRFHHHMIISCGLSMDEVEQLWKKGRRNKVSKIKTDEYGIVGLGNYISKAKKKHKHEKRWRSSTNLEKVVPKKNHYKFKKRKVNEMIRDNNLIQHYLETTYQDYYFLDAETYFNEFNSRWYISARMRRKE